MTFIILALTLSNSLMILYTIFRFNDISNNLLSLIKLNEMSTIDLEYKEVTNGEINKAWKEAIGKYRESEGKI